MTGLPPMAHIKNLTVHKLTDEELMDRFISIGDKDAYTALYMRYQNSLYKYFVWNTGNTDWSADLAQTVLIKLYTQPEMFDTNKNFRIWLFTMAKNCWRNEIRDLAVAQRHRDTVRDKLYVQNVKTEDGEEDITRLKAIHESLGQLGNMHREVIVLKYSNNLSIEEISKVLQCSKGTVKSRLFYAIKKIQNIVKEEL